MLFVEGGGSALRLYISVQASCELSVTVHSCVQLLTCLSPLYTVVFSCSLVSLHCTQLCSVAHLSLSTVHSCVQLLSCLSLHCTPLSSAALLSLYNIHSCVQLLSCLSPLYTVVFSCCLVSLHCTQLCSVALLSLSIVHRCVQLLSCLSPHTLIHNQYLLSLSVTRDRCCIAG